MPQIDHPNNFDSSNDRPRSQERDSFKTAEDRRPSSVAINYGSLGRSVGSYEHREFNYGVPPNHFDLPSGTNRHNPSSTSLPHSPYLLNHNHHYRVNPPSPNPPPPRSNPPAASSPAASLANVHIHESATDREVAPYNRQPQASNSHNFNATSHSSDRSTLWWGELEPWMDEEYAKLVCRYFNWNPVSIKVPRPPQDPTGMQAMNPGYCFLTFSSPAHAAEVLAQVSQPANGGMPPNMPHSDKPFVMNHASPHGAYPAITNEVPLTNSGSHSNAQHYPKEFSIFVGDLAPETSNSDLVAVFQNPVLGLRNDRAPKFIRPFFSCRSAKIMLDPVTGVSKGYGFVRFTDEADQQRALIEMHGLYCLSRPMRVSPATAKYKPPRTPSSFDLPQLSFTPPANIGSDPNNQALTIAIPLPSQDQHKTGSAPIAAAPSNVSLNSNGVSNSGSGTSIGNSQSNNSLSSGTGSSASISTSAYIASSATEEGTLRSLPQDIIGHLFPVFDTSVIKMASQPPYATETVLRQLAAQRHEDLDRYSIPEESWKHHAQARAILGNLIGPNGEQLTSTDPYNTTVFVGGLSPLISEATLRKFFEPYGDIHYVKVPVGKHCGFVQFVRKVDAERAIEEMQGCPIGGSRIRLSWGRSQYKAAQAAAQAAHAALRSQGNASGNITNEQALQILQKYQGHYPPADTHIPGMQSQAPDQVQVQDKDDEQTVLGTFVPRSEVPRGHSTNFSPFSPDPNAYGMVHNSDPEKFYMSSERVPPSQFPRMNMNISNPYGPGYFPSQPQTHTHPHPQPQPHDLKVNTSVGVGGTAKVSPTSLTRPSSGGLYSTFTDSSDLPTQLNRTSGRSEGPISRPPSGQMSGPGSGSSGSLSGNFAMGPGHGGPGHGSGMGMAMNMSAGGRVHENDSIQDLNGTLASLDLDRRDRPWKMSASEIAGNRASS